MNSRNRSGIRPCLARACAGLLAAIFIAGAATFCMETIAAYRDHGHGAVTRIDRVGKQARYFIWTPRGERELRGWLTLVPHVAVGDVVVKHNGSMFIERYAPGTPVASDARWTFDAVSIVAAGCLMTFLCGGLAFLGRGGVEALVPAVLAES